MFRPSTSFRAVVGTVVTVVGALALATATALVFLTGEARRTSEELRAGLESVRLADEAAIDLLVHERIADPLARRDLERRLRDKLARAAEFARSDDELEALRRAGAQVEAYLSHSGGPGREAALEAAFAAIEGLVAASVRRAHAADARAASIDRLGDVLGTGTAALLVVATGWLLWWLRERAFRPLLALADVMRRFGSGEANVRAPDTGPAELRAMARQFNEMAAALAAVRQRQMTLLAAVAHELRTPLSALRLATAALPSGDRQGATDARLALVRRQVHGLERLVTDFLDTARMEAGQLDVRRQPTDIRAIVQNAVSLFGATSPAHRITVRLPDERVVVPCDPGRLEQVMNNLVSNAIKYSPGGGRISVRIDAERDSVRLAVADEGVGIPEAERDGIFEPFRRGRGVERQVPGVGLGLYVSRRIVEAHGGRIDVTSRPGEGATFEVVLPR
jgi:signal transduction histidine kinase